MAAVINLEIFEDESDQEGDNVTISTDGEFVVIEVQLWIEGLGSFELAKIRIHYPVARKIGVGAIGIKETLKDMDE